MGCMTEVIAMTQKPYPFRAWLKEMTFSHGETQSNHGVPRRDSFLCLSFYLIFLLFPFAAFPQMISIGFPEFPANFDLIKSNHPAAQVLRRALGGTLVEMEYNGDEVSYSLRLADHVSIGPDGSEWKLKLREGEAFSNGRKVSGADVIYSLKLCKKQNQLKDISEFSLVKGSGLDGFDRHWIVMHIGNGGVGVDQVFSELSSCPIYDSYAAHVFGDDFGKGTNLISAGRFVIQSFNVGHMYELRRTATLPSRKQGPQLLTLNAFPDVERALGALRGGELALLFYSDDKIEERASSDETLVVSRCLSYKVLYRKGLDVRCNGSGLSVEDLHYE